MSKVEHNIDDIEADAHAGSDGESLYSSTGGSQTTSVTSSVFNYQYENGRRYHNYRAGKYLLPNDEDEQERMDMVHHVWLLMMGGELHKCPLKDPRNVLDLGTGTGLWAVEMGDMYPDAKITGVDLSPIQPGWVPPNVKFEVDDYEDEWTFNKNLFDMVHIRTLAGSVSDWAGLFKSVFEHTKPGGFIEIKEGAILDVYSTDGTFKADGAYARYLGLLREAAIKAGKPLHVVSELGEEVTKAGFTNLQTFRYKWPIGIWPKNPKHKELGKWGLEVFETGCEAYGLALFTRVLGMTDVEAKKIIREAVEECYNPRIHMILDMIVYVAQKPE